MHRLVPLALLVCACNSIPNPTQTTIEPKLSSIQAAVFTPSCAVSGCHDATTQSGNLVLTAAATYAALVNVPAYELAPLKAADGGYVELGHGAVQENLCQDETTPSAVLPKRVVPSDPTDSFLMWKITGKESDGGPIEETTYCAQMPKTNTEMLTTAEVTAIETWIQNGAQND
jgi:hypothetical protein